MTNWRNDPSVMEKFRAIRLDDTMSDELELAALLDLAVASSGSPPSPEKPSARVLDAINWLMGCNGAFEPSPDQLFRGEVPAYWFRSKFAERARLLYDGERYHFDLPRRR